MAKREIQKEQVLERIAEHLLDTGLSASSLRQLADAALTSDRMLLYYFESKADLLEAALQKVALSLLADMETAFPLVEPQSPSVLFPRIVAMIRSQGIGRYMRLWNDVLTEAARGTAPHASIADAIAVGFLQWVEVRLDISDTKERSEIAALLLATVDGISFLEHCDRGRISDLATEGMTRLLGSPTRNNAPS